MCDPVFRAHRKVWQKYDEPIGPTAPKVVANGLYMCREGHLWRLVPGLPVSKGTAYGWSIFGKEAYAVHYRTYVCVVGAEPGMLGVRRRFCVRDLQQIGKLHGHGDEYVLPPEGEPHRPKKWVVGPIKLFEYDTEGP